MLSVSLVSRVTARSLRDNLGVIRHLVSGHEISRLQHGLQLIMARYTRIINCRPCCNVYVLCLDTRVLADVSVSEKMSIPARQTDNSLSHRLSKGCVKHTPLLRVDRLMNAWEKTNK